MFRIPYYLSDTKQYTLYPAYNLNCDTVSFIQEKEGQVE